MSRRHGSFLRFGLSSICVTCCLLVPLTGQTLTRTNYVLQSSPDAWLAPTIVTVGGGALLLNARTEPISEAELALLDISSIPSFDRPATLFSSSAVRTGSDVSLIAAVVLPMLILTEFDNQYLHIAGMYAETIMLAGALPSYAKALGRVRPLAYNNDVPLALRMSPDMRRSFFSGHTTVSMAAGVFLATVYERYRPGSSEAKAFWIGGIGLGLATGALRVLSGMHFPSDVLVGAVVGAVIGYGIPKLHEQITEYRTFAPSSAPPILTLRLSL